MIFFFFLFFKKLILATDPGPKKDANKSWWMKKMSLSMNVFRLVITSLDRLR